MLSLDPAFRAAMLTIEQTAPTFAEAMAVVNRYRNPNPPPKPPHGAKVAIPVLKMWSPSPRPLVSPTTASVASPPKDPRKVLKAVKVRPIIVRPERLSRPADPTEEMIQDACREIRSAWSTEETEHRRVSLDADMRRIAEYWRDLCRSGAIDHLDSVVLPLTESGVH